MREELLRLENIEKFDMDVRILKKFNLNIYKGEVVGLFSLNDVGKSSLRDILCGTTRIDSGRIYFEEKLSASNETMFSKDNKIFIVENKSKLSGNLSVADNIFIIRSNLGEYVINKEELIKKTALFLEVFKIKLDPRKYADKLTHLERCMVELIKAYAIGAKLIIIDDLSSSLSTTDMRKFNRIVIQMKQKGISFIYIDSDLDILFNLSDRIVIMRDGQNMRTFRRDEFKEKNVISVLMGEKFNVDYKRTVALGHKKVIEFEKASTKHLTEMSISILENEIVSFLDVSGKSNESILNMLRGDKVLEQGKLYLSGKEFKAKNEYDMLKQGIGVICEDPIERMLFENWSVVENLYFMLSNKINNMWLKPRIKKSIIQEYYSKFEDVIYKSDLKSLDVGTLYKIVYYRWHLLAPRVLVCVKPFAGLDVYLRNLTQELMDDLTQKGITIIVLSSNITEAYLLGDRIVLLDQTKVHDIFEKTETSLEQLRNVLAYS